MEEGLEVVQEELTNEEIQSLIYTIRGRQVMLDSDVARLYHYKTKVLNLTVKRNLERFPEEFCFQLTEKEVKSLRFQNETLNQSGRGKHRKYLPYAFTEQGIAMLAGILKSDIAIKVSINIIKSFIEMRKFFMQNGQIFDRLNKIECKLLENDKKIDMALNQIQQKDITKQKIFFEGQIYDAYSLIVDIIKRANRKILIIDNYIDDSILKMLSKKKSDVQVTILSSNKGRINELDVQKFNEEYPRLIIEKTNKFHDRFIVIDDEELYHLGASIKDLGKKCFGINRIEDKEYIRKIVSEK